MVSFSLEGKVALITGASRGIGESVSKTLAEYGAHCILVSRKIEALRTVADDIEKKGGKAVAMACHVGYPDSIETLIKEVEDQFGRLDILINNAATNPFFGHMADADEKSWDKTIAVNLKGPFFMIRHAVELMKKNGGGSIVNVSSVNGKRPAPFQGIYSITKAGLIAMTQAYARELAPYHIRVNALLPGITKTDFSNALIENEKIYKSAMQQVPMARHAEPEEMAGAVLYLVSDAASYTTGSCIVCDGGYLA
ncbi:MAG: SDR family oxidoreductase [Desulfococcaceae bacterium]